MVKLYIEKNNSCPLKIEKKLVTKWAECLLQAATAAAEPGRALSVQNENEKFH